MREATINNRGSSDRYLMNLTFLSEAIEHGGKGINKAFVIRVTSSGGKSRFGGTGGPRNSDTVVILLNLNHVRVHATHRVLSSFATSSSLAEHNGAINYATLWTQLKPLLYGSAITSRKREKWSCISVVSGKNGRLDAPYFRFHRHYGCVARSATLLIAFCFYDRLIIIKRRSVICNFIGMFWL